MSDLSDASFRKEESHSADSSGSQETECSLSRCDSSGSIATDAAQPEKSLGCSTSFETAWTDRKHSSYLDFMEANFVQNMFARCYCVEELCGGTPHHHDCHHDHHDQQNQSHTPFEENDDNSAQSVLQSHEMLENDWICSTILGPKAPAGIPRVLLQNPWVQHFRPEHTSSISPWAHALPSRSDGAKRDAQSLARTSPITDFVDHYQAACKNISAPEKPKLMVAASQGDVEDAQKDFISSFWHNGTVDRRALRKKRRILWSTYKQVRRTRQRTDSYVHDSTACNQDDSVAPHDPVIHSISECD